VTTQFLAPPRGDRHRLEHLMGMPIMVDVCDPDFDGRNIDCVFGWLRFVDETFSTYRHDSDVSRLNRGELRLENADAAVRAVARRCRSLWAKTDGYFDAWRHSSDGVVQFDPSGLVKGWSIECAARILEENGARNFCVNAGGDLVLRGNPEDSPSWSVGIQHPQERDQIALTMLGRDVAIATSGAYERGEHIVDPHTGAHPEAVLSVTVAGPDLGTADAYATAIYAMGEQGPEWALGLETYAAMMFRTDGTALSTPNFDRYRLPNERAN
jgi:thiamine biosynthesis lipoprotein